MSVLYQKDLLIYSSDLEVYVFTSFKYFIHFVHSQFEAEIHHFFAEFVIMW